MTSRDPPLHDMRRRRDGRRVNQRIKLLADVMNTLGAGMLGAGIVVPFITSAQAHPDWQWAGLWILGAVTLHCGGQAALQFLMSED